MNLFEQGIRPDMPSNVKPVVQGNIQFAIALYQKLRPAEGNLFFSPYSISAALGMVYAGARGNTQAEIAQALHFPTKHARLHPAFAWLEAYLAHIGTREGAQLKTANRLWPQAGYPFLEEYLALVKQHYGTLITPVDYRANAEAARQTINAWVEEKTESKIRDLLTPGMLDDLARLVLVNAIYFKGNWANPFDQRLTHKAPFWITPTESVQTPMMTHKGSFGYRESDGVKVLELPYNGNDLSMIVLLPQEVGGLAKLEETLSSENLARWTGRLYAKEVEVFLPRFEVSGQFRLDGALKSLGMGEAFTNRADFSGMDGSKELYINAALHKAFVTVNEEGAEAAAATAITMKLLSYTPEPPVFRADHPFISLIRENNSGSILFLGRVINPK